MRTTSYRVLQPYPAFVLASYKKRLNEHAIFCELKKQENFKHVPMFEKLRGSLLNFFRTQESQCTHHLHWG